jgi:hypothetical protein
MLLAIAMVIVIEVEWAVLRWVTHLLLAVRQRGKDQQMLMSVKVRRSADFLEPFLSGWPVNWSNRGYRKCKHNPIPREERVRHSDRLHRQSILF